jgi:hypothetical protein
MTFQNNYKKSTLLTLLGGGYVLWCWLFKDFFLGKLFLYKDVYTNYCIFKYFYNNLFNGIIPLWEPFVYLGRPHIHSALSGALNPIAFLIFSLHYLGFNYSQLYFLYLAVYYFIGIIGFFILAKRILKYDSYALIAAWLLMFSGMGALLFNQIFIVLIFVPAVWFFAFFFQFFETFSLKDFWGMVVSLMVLCISYYPFYFLTLFFVFLIFFCLFSWTDFCVKTKSLWIFIKSHVLSVLVGIVLILCSALPLFVCQIINQSGEVVSPARQGCEDVADLTKCSSGLQMNFDQVAVNGAPLEERVSLDHIFSHLNKINYADECVFYIPLLAYLFIFCSIFTLFDKTRWIILGTVFTTFLLSLGYVFIYFKFFFDHIFYFKYFRNLFFYTAFLIPGIILFSVAQFKALIEQFVITNNRRGFLLNLFIGVILFYVVGIFQGHILLVSKLTVGLFIGILILIANRSFYLKYILLFLLGVLMIIEPIGVFRSYQNHIPPNLKAYPSQHVVPQFRYLRPLNLDVNPDYLERYFGNWLHSYMFLYNACFYDAPGFVSFQSDLMQKHVANLFNNPLYLDKKIDTHHKLILYSNNEEIPLEKDSQDFKVLHFDVNSLVVETDLNKEYFLVYNDAYSKFWKVFINARESKIDLANVAFKGVHVPAGKQVIEFRFCPPGGQGVYLLVLMGMFIALFLLIESWWKYAKNRI